MYSGVSNAYINIAILFPKEFNVLWTPLRQVLMRRVSTGSGILGWIATHVHRNIVVMQLHIMPSSVLQLLISLHAEGALASAMA
jgi:hypothetical protein